MTDPTPTPRPDVNAVLWAFVAFAIGEAVLVSNGNLHPTAIRWLTAGVVVGVGSFAVRRWPAVIASRAQSIFTCVVPVLLCVELAQSFTRMPGIYLRPTGPEPLFLFGACLATLGVLVGGGLSDKPWLGRLHFPAVLVVFVVLGAWLIRSSPNPFIDVFVFQRDATTALISGENPYALRYPDIYGNSPFYGEGLSVNGRLAFGFPYPPMSLYTVVPFQLAFGDYRYAQLAAMAGAAALMGYARPGPVGKAIAALYLFMPRTLFVLEQGWTEPIVVFAVALVVFLSVRWPRWVPMSLGFLLVLKQYLVFALPLAWLVPGLKEGLSRRGRFALEVLLPGLVSLPLALWSVKDFWFDVVALQVYQPFRVEALSYLAWWASEHGGEKPPTVLAFVAALIGVGLVLWRAPRTAAGFAGGLGLVMMLFFAFNKQAFCNYYALVVGAFACAAACSREEVVTPPDGPAPSVTTSPAAS